MISARSKTSLHRSRFGARGTPKPSRREPVSKQERRMQIGILGSGLMGGKLGTIWARAGHEVVFSYARSEQKLKRLAREAKGRRERAHRVKPRAKQTRSCLPCTGPESTTS